MNSYLEDGMCSSLYLCYLFVGLYSPAAMKNYKALDAHRYYQSGFVHEIKHMVSTLGFFVLKCEVSPSYRTAVDLHKPWVCINKDGDVMCGHCNCMAG